MNNSKLQIVVLAAGGSSRLGQSKQLLVIKGKSLVSKSAQTASELAQIFHLNKPTVIVGKDHQKVEQELSYLDVFTVFNERWLDGMGVSIATAISSLDDQTNAILLMTCDQVLLSSKRLIPLIKHWQNAPNQIIASAYEGIVGVPAIFPKQYFSELSKLSSDKGARVILQKYKQQVATYPMPEAAQDLDTAADEAAVRTLLEDQL